jgi:hypothetical protein
LWGLERAMRFELTTSSLATKCSTTELRPHLNDEIIVIAIVAAASNNNHPHSICKLDFIKRMFFGILG